MERCGGEKSELASKSPDLAQTHSAKPLLKRYIHCKTGQYCWNQTHRPNPGKIITCNATMKPLKHYKPLQDPEIVTNQS